MFPVDEKRFRIALSQIAGTRGVGIAVKEGCIQGDRLVERPCAYPAPPRGATEYSRLRMQISAKVRKDASLAASYSRTALRRPTIPSWVRSSLSPPARKSGRAHESHQTGYTAPDKRFLRLAAAVGSQAAERLVRQGSSLGMSNPSATFTILHYTCTCTVLSSIYEDNL